ncbi:olfactory receptor 10A3-like [Cynoglossus semilaevis]|uniref:Olfactory receptor n=1 Tax=Cynoglossus semilaevis TaxID=244447 RepID=A0A3P8V4J1_CYNSE|nr:olfactory receptor 10A3-like [Cynoglossus semilaevis]
MFNSTGSFFVLGGYLPFGHLNYLYFTILAMIYTSIVVSNTCVIVVICMNRSLHEPMYLFLCSLFVNELYGSTALFPFLLIQVLSDVHTVPRSLCFLQVFCIHTYGNIEICNLAVMSYDRYVAICCPLQYNRRMTTLRALVFITVVWLYCFVRVLITVALNLRLTLCGNFIDKVRCANYPIVKLACSDTTVNNIYGLFGTVLSVVLPLFPMLFSYLRIFKVCFSGSKQTRQKALSTCSPQLVSLVNFSFGCFFEIVQNRFEMRAVPKTLKIFLSLYILIIQPILNPLLFGLQMSKIRKSCKHLFTHKNKVTCHIHLKK